jgi:poly-gamma-glutamate capsule biosynthesis protein CapA/YwtB (metallophosphatase superfamily)
MSPRTRPPRAALGVRRIGAALTVALLAASGAGCSAAGADPAPQWRVSGVEEPSAAPSRSGGAAAPAPSASAAPAKAEVISLSATGDIIMGNAPNKLPAGNGKNFFAGVKAALAADLVMGNLEEPLTEDTGSRKCGANSSGCHQFRAPPDYAAHLRDGGFELLNQANNHGNDYGPAGYRNTQKALEKYGLKHTGAPDQITVVDVSGVKVGVAGFSSYPWNNSLVDIDAARRVIAKAATLADIVVVQVHMGAEGSDKTRVRPGTEMFLGENRGDPVRFSHAMIDAGADLVVGHGPHVMRGLEFYKGRLIAYSLGNFAGGGGTLNTGGNLGLGAVLKVSLAADGSWSGGQFIATNMYQAGRPVVDPDQRGLTLVRGLSTRDFPSSGARLGANGKISPPA